MLAKEKNSIRNYSSGVESYDLLSILRCDGCDTLFVRRDLYDSTDIGTSEDYLFWDAQTFHWPSNPKFNFNEEHFLLAPKDDENLNKIKSIMQQVCIAISNEIHTLAAIGIRAIVEATYDALNLGNLRNLEKKIDALGEAGLITKIERETLHLLRLVGNSAAHEVWTPSYQDITNLYKVAQRLVEKSLLDKFIQINLAEKAKLAADRIGKK
ncbi:MAG: DUF4145 domain-containing protein [Caulobacterales bacterium]|nr:DUF4145 domain-containing protein [Caulobacterales bacterium]MCA0371857.1 DUF4145 domain-containing protein [Pseudomonadota bacterium]